MEENARESQREYLDAKSLLVRVRQAVSGVDAPPPHTHTHTPDCFHPHNATGLCFMLIELRRS